MSSGRPLAVGQVIGSSPISSTIDSHLRVAVFLSSGRPLAVGQVIGLSPISSTINGVQNRCTLKNSGSAGVFSISRGNNPGFRHETRSLLSFTVYHVHRYFRGILPFAVRLELNKSTNRGKICRNAHKKVPALRHFSYSGVNRFIRLALFYFTEGGNL